MIRIVHQCLNMDVILGQQLRFVCSENAALRPIELP